ncbi:MAG: SGNH/GDSL hydrolase family protein [Burkholderiales bacterium]
MSNFPRDKPLQHNGESRPISRSVQITAWALLTVILYFTLEVFSYFIYASKLPYDYDHDLGWVLKPSYQTVFNTQDVDGTWHLSHLKTDSHGFRAWGDIKTNKKKLLIIGDSFTAHPYTSDDQAYFSVAAKQLNMEIFAGGGGGYGTLQELILLEKYVKEINPDIFVLQFCSNDFSDNHHDFKTNSIVRNQSNFRPYLHQGRIIKNNHSVYRIFYRFSYTFRILDIGLQKLQYAYYQGYSAKPSDPTSASYMQGPYTITAELMKQMKATLPAKTKAYTINCNTRTQPLRDYWMEISSKSGFTPLPGVSQAVEIQEANGETVRVKDGSHWNITGNRIVGEELSKAIYASDVDYGGQAVR